MPGSLLGGNSPSRVTKQKQHQFRTQRTKLESMDKHGDLIPLAKELGIYESIPRNGSSDKPLKEDLVEALDTVAQSENR